MVWAGMAYRFQFDELETFDADQFRDDSFQLEAFRVCDFDTAMDGELAKVISRGSNIRLRYLPLIERIANDKASLYVKRPTRVLDAGTVARTQKLEDIYRRSRFDRFLLNLQQRAEAQNSMVVALDPHPLDPRAVVPRSFIPGEVSIESSDLMLDDIRLADKVKIRVPLKKENSVIGQERVLFGHRCYTRDEAYIEGPDGKRVGIFNDEMTNPFGYVPLLSVRLTEPRKGWHLPRLPLDLLSVQIGLIIGISDIENMVRLKAAGREVVVGQGARFAVSKINAGPEGILPLEGDELSYQSVTTAPAVDKYLTAIETTVRLLANYKYVNPDGLWSSSGITGAAKEMERQEMLEDRQRREHTFADFEQDLVKLVADTARLGPSALSIGDPTLSIDYHYVRSRGNDLQSAQASALNFALGLDSAVDVVSASEGVKRSEAQAMIAERLNDFRAWVDAMRDEAGEITTPPGLDSIASQVMLSSEAPEPTGTQ